MNVRLGHVALMVGLLGAVGCGSVSSPLLDAPPDVDGAQPPIDGPPPVPKFDVGYINEFTLAWNYAGTGVLGFLAVANTSTMAMDLNKVIIAGITDDDDTITSVFTLESPSDTPLQPGKAAGLLSGPATVRIVESGLMTEPRDDEMLSFGMSFPNQSVAFVGKTLHPQVTIQIGDGEIVLPFTVHFVESQVALADGAARLHAH
jgi:hypothetical protein